MGIDDRQHVRHAGGEMLRDSGMPQMVTLKAGVNIEEPLRTNRAPC